MKKLSFLTACLFIVFFLQAQPDPAQPEKNQRPSMASVRTIENKTISGWLYAVNDSQVVLKKSLSSLYEPIPGNGQRLIPSEQIKEITLQKRNSALRGTLIGLGLGTLTGIIIGFASGDDPIQAAPPPQNDPWGFGSLFTNVNNSLALKAEEKAFLGAVGLGGTGAIAGLIIGALAKKKFIIGSKKENYRDLQGELMMRLVQK